MARRSKGTEETDKGDVIIGHDDLVKFKVQYGKDWPTDKPKHMKEGSVHQLHERHAKTLVDKGVGVITEYLNEKRDKTLDAKAKGKGNAAAE